MRPKCSTECILSLTVVFLSLAKEMEPSSSNRLVGCLIPIFLSPNLDRHKALYRLKSASVTLMFVILK